MLTHCTSVFCVTLQHYGKLSPSKTVGILLVMYNDGGIVVRFVMNNLHMLETIYRQNSLK